MPRLDLIKLRRGTAAEWLAANPVLETGEPGYETDTKVYKIGDGATAWTSLAAVTGVTGGEAVVAAATNQAPILYAVPATNALAGGWVTHVNNANANGHGECRVPRGGAFTIADGFEVEVHRGVRIINEASKITYTGNGTAFTFKQGGIDLPKGPQFIGGEFNGNATAQGGILVQDMGGTFIDDVKFNDWLGGPAVEYRNVVRWSENNHVGDLTFGNCLHAIKWTPTDIDPGSKSFARFDAGVITLNGGVSGGPQLWFAGGLYGSTINKIVGNIGDGVIGIRFDNANAGSGGAENVTLFMRGSEIGTIDLENTTGGAEVSYAFEAISGGGDMPIKVGNMHLSALVQEWNGTAATFAAETKFGKQRLRMFSSHGLSAPAGNIDLYALTDGKVYADVDGSAPRSVFDVNGGTP